MHLVDPGIDTGGVLAQATFAVTPTDTIATYPYLHLAAGLPLLGDQVDRALAGQKPLAPWSKRSPTAPADSVSTPPCGSTAGDG